MKAMKNPVASRLTLAVQGALIAMYAIPGVALADEAEVAALITPKSVIEVGISNVDVGSAKLGEYNGLTKSGATAVGNFSLRNGSAYDATGGVYRWSLTGTDLGTTSREVRATASQQGLWSFGMGYDELRHSISDTYQTPYAGNNGDNNFTLPATFGVINTAYVGPAPGYKIGAQALSASQLAAFHQTDVYTDRKNTNIAVGYSLDRRWAVKFEFNHLDQTGAKLFSPGTDAGKYLTFASGFEKTVMLMNPTNYQTDTMNLAVQWNGDKGHLSVGYFGSYFHDGYNGLNFSNPFLQSGSGATATTPLNGTAYGTAFPVNTISTAPSNDFHQINLNGGYAASSAVRVTGNLSYARNTQDELFSAALMQAGGLPLTSLNGLVLTTHADLKVTDQFSKDLVLSAAYKYSKRDNQTAAATYKFIDLGGENATSVSAPMSNSKTQYEFAGDYRMDASQKLRATVTYEDVQRWCNDNLSNTAVGVLPSGYAANNPTQAWTNTSCAQIPEARESKVALDYRARVGDDASVNLGYSTAQRQADVNTKFYNPMQAIAAGYELLGYRAFFQASRKEQTLKAGASVQASDKVSLGLTGRYLIDEYTDSALGVQNGKSYFVNLDMSYAASESATLTGYISTQDRRRDMREGNGLLVPGTPAKSAIYTPADKIWTNQLTDIGTTVGIAFNQKELMGGKLDLNLDWSYSLGNTGYTTQVGYSIATAAIPNLTCDNTQNLTCGSTPDIRSESVTFKINGTYKVDKASSVSVTYAYLKQNAADYYYNGYQNGYTPSGLLPTNEAAPKYIANVVAVSYIYRF